MIGLFLSSLLAYTFQVHTNADLVFDIERIGDMLVLATNGGVVLYDPVNFQTLRKFTNLEGMPGNVVRDLTVDPDGGIWAVSEGGLAYRPPRAASFEAYPTVRLPLWVPGAQAIVYGDTKVLVGGPGGILVIETQGTYSPGDDHIRVLNQAQGFPFPSDTVVSLNIRLGTLYAGFYNGWGRAPLDQVGQPTAWETFGSDGPIVFEVIEDGPVGFLATNSGLIVSWGEVSQIFFPDTVVWDLAMRNDTLFAATEGGAWMVLPTLRAIWTYYPDVRTLLPLGPDLWGGLGWKRYPDEQSPVPTAAGWGGLARAPSTEPPAEFYHIEGLYSNVITTAERGDSTIWIGSFFQPYRSVNLARYNGQSYEGTGFRWPVYSLEPEGDSAVWVATWGEGVLRVAFRDSAFVATDTLRPGGARYILDLARTPDGRVVISIGAERPQPTTFLVDPRTGMVRNIDDSFMLPAQCEVDDSGRIWIASEGQVRVYDTTGVLLASFSPASGVPEGRTNIVKAAGGSVWIGGQSGLAEFRGLQWVRDFPALSSQEVLDLEVWESALLVLTTEGLWVLSRSSGEVLESLTLENAPFPDSLELQAGRAPLPQVRNSLALLPDHDQVWIGTRGGALVVQGLLSSLRTGLESWIFPNPLPVGENLKVHLPARAQIRLLTLRGERIWQGEMGPGEATIPTETLAPGLYLILIKGENFRQVFKLGVK